ncbi:MAG: T9SS type A sorting domain-containing protein [Bacteroidota bacterium]
MKQLKTLLLAVVLTAFAVQSQAQQTRYLDEIFTNVTVTSDTAYGQNYSILPIILQQSTVPVLLPLVMDVYQPMGDTATNRPLVLIAHTGTFFPPIANGTPYGSKTDSILVELATRMAKRGYVVACPTYRQGWNALGDALAKQKTLLQAAYRGIQDMRACIRYFRNTAANGNGWGIDANRIVMGGSGTGAYLSYPVGYLDKNIEILKTKFIDFSVTPAEPFVDTVTAAGVYGLEDVPGSNFPNFPTESSDVQMVFGIGGALGDRSWVDGGPPVVGIHTTMDPFAPYNIADVIEPINGDIVIGSAAGGLGVTEIADSVGINDVFKNAVWADDLTPIVNGRNGGIPGLLNFITPFYPDSMVECITGIQDTVPQEGSPWNWFNETFYAAAWDMQMNPPIPGSVEVCLETLVPNDPVRARRYADTIMDYLLPRMAVALDLRPARDSVLNTTSIDQPINQVAFSAYPNPAQNSLIIELEDASQPILQVELYDLSGRRVYAASGLRTFRHEIQRGNLTDGVYLLKAQVENGLITEKIIFE